MQRREWIHLAGKLGTLWLLSQAKLTASWKTSDWTFQNWSDACLDLALQLRAGNMSALAWQDAMAHLYQKVDLDELRTQIDFEKLTRELNFPIDQSVIVPIQDFPRKKEIRLAPKLFGNRKGTAVIPHVHNDMVSIHLVLQGQFLARTYNRIFENEKKGILQLNPIFEGYLNPGSSISMSDDFQNGHWLVAQKNHSFTLDIAITDLGSNRKYTNRANRYSMIFCDPTRPQKGGMIHAPILSFKEALMQFGQA